MGESGCIVCAVVIAVMMVGISRAAEEEKYVSAVGDPGMKRDGLRVAFEAWNFCNEVGQEAPLCGSPRAADCFDLSPSASGASLNHKVTKEDNKLGAGKPFKGLIPGTEDNADLYAAQKEHYLGSLCQVDDLPRPWQFWMIMLKNGNFDTKSSLCPANGKPTPPFSSTKFPCFGKGCMNQPSLNHQETALLSGDRMRGGFNGTYDLGSDTASGVSFFEVAWEKKVGEGGWVFRHKLKTSKKYPWLMLYLRADATHGFSGGYHYDTRGMLKTLPESPNFKVRLSLEIKRGGGPKSQFYLIDFGSCWKNNGEACDGDVASDVTRYSEMIVNPATPAWCSPKAVVNCPPFHVTPNHTKIYRNDTANFPYGAYHYYCAPGNAKHLEQPVSTCDPYSNPQAQEIVQVLPHPVWAHYGFPTHTTQVWESGAATWELDVGGLSASLYFYQDPRTEPARRIWTSIDVGTEIFVSEKDEVAEWTLSDFDVLIAAPHT